MAKSRLVGSYPVIGIRPTIDGRRGALDVRGSLEEQTMNMAKSAAKLFEENLKYSNGEPVKVVIADTTIGRVGESAACADKFRREGVDITVTVTPCWCYGAETMDMDPQTIKAVWGFNGTERPGAVYLASVLATHAQKGLPAFGIYGHDVQEADDTSIPEDVKEKLLRFGRAAVAAAPSPPDRPDGGRWRSSPRRWLPPSAGESRTAPGGLSPPPSAPTHRTGRTHRRFLCRRGCPAGRRRVKIKNGRLCGLFYHSGVA